MKRYTIIAIAGLLALLCACGTPNLPTEKETEATLQQYLVDRSIELTCVMDSMAQSEDYRALAVPMGEVSDLVEDIGTSDYTKPSKAVLFRVSDEDMRAMLEHNMGTLDLPDAALDMLLTRMGSSIPQMLNAMQGVNALAATSVLSVGKAYPEHSDFKANTFVLLAYSDYYSVTFFRKSGDSITPAASSFLYMDDEMRAAVRDMTVSDYIAKNYAGLGLPFLSIEYMPLTY